MWCVVCAGDDETEVWGPYESQELAAEAVHSLADEDENEDDNYEVVQMQQT